MTIWNEVAPRYHKRWASEDKGPFASTKKLVDLVDIKKGNKVLDVACGTGVVTKKITQKIGKTGYVIGADTSITAIKIAKKWNNKTSNLFFVNADAENLSFKEKFNVITCQYALFFSKCLKSPKKYEKKSQRIRQIRHVCTWS